ncbi:MAG: antibiotic biosynthesis monooxygenase [Phycisphaerae bacterium]
MVVTCVSVQVRREHVDDFARASVENSKCSLQEPGNMRFDVLQSADDPTLFTLYEAYESEEAAAAHKQTPHYLKWRETVESWMARPRVGLKHRVVYPDEKAQW